MPPKNQVVVKTDASTRDGQGSGLAFVASINDGCGIEETHTGKTYVSRKLTTTEAETLATLFAFKEIHEIFKYREDYIKDYAVVIESDCEHTVRRVKETHYDREIDKFIKHYKRLFGNVRARWIPRTDNGHADAMARETLRKGEEE
jgi:ribonuclease HI